MSKDARVSKIAGMRVSLRRLMVPGRAASNAIGSGRRRTAWKGLFCQSGTSAIEFAFLAPLFLLIVMGTCQFAMVFSNYVTLEHAAALGARALAISRGDSTPVSDTNTQVLASAGTLNQSNIAISYSINGTSCSSDATCSPQMAAGVPASIVATYPCSLVVMGTDFLPGCSLSVTSAETVE
jgi:Flp pilus assembly protein TadG